MQTIGEQVMTRVIEAMRARGGRATRAELLADLMPEGRWKSPDSAGAAIGRALSALVGARRVRWVGRGTYEISTALKKDL